MNLMVEKLSTFLETFPYPLHHIKPEFSENWVFWREDEEDNESSSADIATNRMIHEKIKSFFSYLEWFYHSTMLQLWVPVTIDGRRLLSTSGQPFSVNRLDNSLANYRLRSLEYRYTIDEPNDNLDIPAAMIISGSISNAFINRLVQGVNLEEQGSLLERYALDSGLLKSYLVPICCPSLSTSSCVGVLEFSSSFSPSTDFDIFIYMKYKLERVGLSVFDVQEHIPYKNINGLKPLRDEVEEALEIVCESHKIGLAQVWISIEDENRLTFSSSLEDTRKNRRMLTLKLSGYCVNGDSIAFQDTFQDYYDTCNMLPLHTGKELVEQTFQDYQSRLCLYMSNLSQDTLMSFAGDDSENSALVICLRSTNTGKFDYVFEFIWEHNSNYLIFMMELVLTLKKCLPSFKFASGGELGDEFHVIDVDNSTTSETQILKIFQGQKVSIIPEALEGRKLPVVENYLPHSKGKYKTTPIPLSRQAIEQQFGNTMKEAAKNLNVSLSTLKRKSHGYGISEWQGPSIVKRKVNDSSSNQRDTNEEDNGVFQNPSAVNKNEDTLLIIKAEYAGDMIKFYLSILEATFVTVEREIGIRFKLTAGTYKIKYLDEDKDWILLISDQDLTDCIRSSRKLHPTVVRLRVQQFTQPNCSEICCS